MEDQLKPNLNRKLYTINIDVCENGNVFNIRDVEKGYILEYQHIIGAMEIVKGAFLRDHGAKATKALEEKLAKEKIDNSETE